MFCFVINLSPLKTWRFSLGVENKFWRDIKRKNQKRVNFQSGIAIDVELQKRITKNLEKLPKKYYFWYLASVQLCKRLHFARMLYQESP